MVFNMSCCKNLTITNGVPYGLQYDLFDKIWNQLKNYFGRKTSSTKIKAI
jgi:hypothetical protein